MPTRVERTMSKKSGITYDKSALTKDVRASVGRATSENLNRSFKMFSFILSFLFIIKIFKMHVISDESPSPMKTEFMPQSFGKIVIERNKKMLPIK